MFGPCDCLTNGGDPVRWIERVKKNGIVGVVAIIYLLLLVISPEMAKEAFNNSLYYLKEMVFILPVIFLLTVVIEALIPKEVIVKNMGENSGFTGNVLSLILGSVSAGPIYAAFPVSKSLLSKGASISNIVIILSAWAVVKVPMLLNEIKFLGAEFMTVRWILTVVGIFIMGAVTAKLVKKEDLPLEVPRNTEDFLSIDGDYCIGCGLCVKISSEYYEMKGEKAVVKKIPTEREGLELIHSSISKCPTQAISMGIVLRES